MWKIFKNHQSFHRELNIYKFVSGGKGCNFNMSWQYNKCRYATRQSEAKQENGIAITF